jgi:hypothetical protein
MWKVVLIIRHLHTRLYILYGRVDTIGQCLWVSIPDCPSGFSHVYFVLHCLSCRTSSYFDDSHPVGLVRFMVFNATFSNISVISWRSVLIGWGNGGPGEHRPAASHRRTLSHNAVSSTPRPDRDSKSQHQWW